MESGIVGFIAIAVLTLSVLWFIFSFCKGLLRSLVGSKHHDTSATLPLRKLDRPIYRVSPSVQASPDRSQFNYRLVPFGTEDGQGRGYVVEQLADSQRLAWEFLDNRRHGLESIGVAGETYHIDDLQADSFRPPARLLLVPEPMNRYDPNAIAVWDAAKRYQAGYIPTSEAKRIRERIRKGQIAECLSIWETIVNSKRVSLRMLLVSKKARLEWPISS